MRLIIMTRYDSLLRIKYLYLMDLITNALEYFEYSFIIEYLLKL